MSNVELFIQALQKAMIKQRLGCKVKKVTNKNVIRQF